MKSIAQIRTELETAGEDALPRLLEMYAADDRKGVRNLIEAAAKRAGKRQAEADRVQGMIDFERTMTGKAIYCGCYSVLCRVVFQLYRIVENNKLNVNGIVAVFCRI